MVSAGFMPAGPQLAATKMAAERCLLSVRLIRAEATFFKLHVLPLAQGQRRARNDRRFKVAANCCFRPVKPDGRQFKLVTYGTKMVLKRGTSIRNFSHPGLTLPKAISPSRKPGVASRSIGRTADYLGITLLKFVLGRMPGRNRPSRLSTSRKTRTCELSGFASGLMKTNSACVSRSELPLCTST